MNIRSKVLAIAFAVLFTAALGGIATADDQMPGQQDGVEKVTGKDSAQTLDRGGRMTRPQDDRDAGEGRIDPRAEIRAGRMGPERPDPTRGSPFSKGY